MSGSACPHQLTAEIHLPESEQSGIPNPCTSCPAGKNNEWAYKELRAWTTTSPWGWVTSSRDSNPVDD